MRRFLDILPFPWKALLRRHQAAAKRVAGAVLFGTALVAVVTFSAAAPSWMWDGYGATLERLEAVVKVATPLVILFGLYIAWRRSAAHERQAETAAVNAEIANRNAKTAEQGQITERFTKAVEQLADERLAVRLGGIYALERIANDSNDRDHKVVFEVLCAFVRDECPRKPDSEYFAKRLGEALVAVPHLPPGTYPHLEELPQDVLAALEVIRRRQRTPDGEAIDLHDTSLAGANLAGARLEHANLRRAYLQQADLPKAILKGAHLRMAHLIGARLAYAHLEAARLIKTNLEGAVLVHAHLERAKFIGAFLAGAFLDGAHLQGADFSGALGMTSLQVVDAHGDEDTRLPKNCERPSHWPPARGEVVDSEEEE